MVHHQYHIPEQQGPQPAPQAYETPLNEALRIADTLRYTPESQPEAYRFFNDAADRIDSHFEDGLESDRNRKRSIRESLPWVPRRDLTLNEIIDMTSELVHGKGSGRRFWKGNRHEHPAGERNDAGEKVAHWYFEEQAWLANGKPSSIVLHFETRPTQVVKWHLSIPHEPNLKELENLIQHVNAYETLVREKLSPLDSAIHDFKEEILEEEQIIAKGTEEVMFSQQAIDRMIANHHQARLAEEARQQQNTDKDYPMAA